MVVGTERRIEWAISVVTPVLIEGRSVWEISVFTGTERLIEWDISVVTCIN